MRYHKLDMNLLVALDAILEDPHVTRVAERLRISQPALSGSLAKLRAYFGDELVMQVGRRLELTDLARELRAPVRDLLQRADVILAQKGTFVPESASRAFTVSCTDYVWTTLIGRVLARLRTDAPQVAVEYGGTTKEFIERRVELLVVAERFAVPAFPSEPLFADPMVCVVWIGNREVGDTISEAQYLAARHVVAFAPLPQLVDDWLLKTRGVRRTVGVRVPNYSLMPEAVIDTPFVATLPRLMAANYERRLPIRAVRHDIGFPALVEVLQWHPHQEGDSGLRWFRDVISAEARRLPAGDDVSYDANAKAAAKAGRRKSGRFSSSKSL